MCAVVIAIPFCFLRSFLASSPFPVLLSMPCAIISPDFVFCRSLLDPSTSFLLLHSPSNVVVLFVSLPLDQTTLNHWALCCLFNHRFASPV